MVIFMNIAKTYGNIVRRYIDTDPEKAKKLIIRGLYLESFRIRHFYDKRIPKAYKHLNYYGIRLVADALKKPETLAWTNIFAPVEILQNFGLTSVSMECLSSYLSGFWLEDAFIDRAETEAIAQTLCSYHKNFIGAADAGVIPKPAVGVTTSMVCDGNVQSFRYLHEQMGIPVYIIDVPYEDTPEAVQYVREQLQELIAMLEDITGRRFDEAAQSPTYRYYDRPETYADAVEHVVWFENARSVREKLLLGAEYGLGGFGVWNIMRYFPALWTLLSRMFRIRKSV